MIILFEYLFHFSQVGYGRGTPTSSLWIGNLSSKTNEADLSRIFNAFGPVQECRIDRQASQAIIRYISIENCTKAFGEMHGKNLDGKHIAVRTVFYVYFLKLFITDWGNWSNQLSQTILKDGSIIRRLEILLIHHIVSIEAQINNTDCSEPFIALKFPGNCFSKLVFLVLSC